MKNKLQKFEMKTIKRSQITQAPYNPRTISESAFKRLEKGLKKHGLVVPLTWNEKTGNLVSGHQRLLILDKTENYPDVDYDIEVAVINVSEKEEKHLNVQLNNTSMQGEFDIEKLNDMINAGADVMEFGFSEAEVNILFENSGLGELLQDSEEVEEEKDILDDIKADRKEMQERQREENSADFYFVVVCESQNQKDELFNMLDIPVYEQFVPGDIIIDSLKGL